MTASNPPPDGSERVAARLRAATERVADKPQRELPAGKSTTKQSALPAKSTVRPEVPPTAGIAPGAVAAEKKAATAQRLSSAAAQSDKPATAAPERRANGEGGAGLAAPTTGQRAQDGPPNARPAAATPPSPARASLPYSRAVPGAGEPYPPLSERLVNGIGMAPTASKRPEPKRITPRSPRTALEPDRVEMPTRRSTSARHPLVIVGNAIISVFVLLALVVGFMLYVGKQRFDAPGPLPDDRIVNIPRGSGIRDIADVLTHEGVIDQPWVFIGGVLVLKAREDLKAGEYQFKAHASLHDVVATIVEGKVVMHQFSLPEGLTSEQIVARLLDDDVLTGNIKEIPAEGSLLPDTYNFSRGVTREQMIQRMQQAQQRLVKEIWDRRSPDLPLQTPEQLVILASLVEKETAKPEERTRIAAVFVNRLKQRMRLQSDPTIIYGLVGGKGTLGRPLTKSEIDQPTPYNTYQIDGLPPGPIANPGRASLEAAANPARTRELYFVADGTGGHAFAESYEQHQKNVARLRLIESGQREQVPADSQATSASPQPAAASSPPRTTSHRRAEHTH